MTLYAYIDLTQTDYTPQVEYEILSKDVDTAPLLEIYRQYAIHKKFESVWPIYAEELVAPHNDIIAYRDNGEIVAWTMMYRMAKECVWNMQFAWNYANPKLKLGYKSLRTECAIYRDRGYTRMLIDENMKYKSELQGYNIMGPMT
jgi:hypothetical protein